MTTIGIGDVALTDGDALIRGNKAAPNVVGLRKVHLVPLIRPVSGFVHQGQASAVESVVVDGRWLMHERLVLTMDEAHVLAEADRIGRRAWSAVALPDGARADVAAGAAEPVLSIDDLRT